MSAHHASQPRTARAGLAVLGALLLALALSNSAQALEVANHPFKKTLISGLEQGVKPPTPKLENPCGVTVGSSAEIYVADYQREMVHGPVGIKTPGGPCGLAIDGEGDLYVNIWHGEVIKYTPNIYPPPGPGEPPLIYSSAVIDTGPATGVAVDPATEDLLVDHRDRIDVYAAPVEPETAPATTIGSGTLEEGFGVAASVFPETQGQVYVADAGDNTVKVYEPPLANPVRTIDGAGSPQGGFVSLFDSTLATDQITGEVFVADNTQPGFEHPLAVVDEFNHEGLFRGQLEHTLIDGEPLGIGVNERPTPVGNEATVPIRGEIYVTSGNGSSEVLQSESGPPFSEQGALFSYGPPGAGFKLAVTRSGGGQGSVATTPAGIACPAACEAEYNSGSTVTLNPTAAPGSVFVGWSGACTGPGTCQVTLGADASVDAKFEPAPALFAVPHAASPTATPPGPSSAALQLGRPSAAGAAAILRATVPGPGTLTVTGKGLKRARLHLAHGGSVGLRLRLSRAGRRVLAASKRGRLAVRVSATFTPSTGGSDSTASRTVTFKQG